MQFTVRQALAMEALKNARLIAGEKGLDRIIRYVDSSETPDANLWVRANDFVITTGYSIKDSLPAQLTLLRCLANAGGAALAIKFSRFIGEVPKELAALADALEIPLIGLPGDLPFIDITHPLMTRILNEQAESLAYSERVYLTLTQIALGTNSLDALAEGLSDILQEKTHIYVHSLRPRIFADLQASQVFPVSVEDKVYGYVAIETTKPLSQQSMIAIKHAQTLAALQLINKELATESSRSYQRDFLEGLLAGRIRNEELIAARAREIGFSLEGAKFLFIVDIDNFSTYLCRSQLSEKAVVDLKRTLFHIVADTLSAAYGPHQSLAVQQSGRIVVICPAAVGRSNQQQRAYLQKLFNRIHQKVKEAFKDIALTIAVSKQIKALSEFQPVFLELHKIISTARKMNEMARDIFWEDAEVYLLLHNMDRSLVNFYQDVFRKLEDTKTKGSLLHTLQTYLNCQGNLSEAAAQLFVHRNTLRYRLNRIEDLLGKDLNSPETRFMLWLALKAYCLDHAD